MNQPCPDLSSLQCFHEDKLPTHDANKALLITFFSKLNKSDFPTFTVLNDLLEKEEFKGKLDILAISRDNEPSDVEKFPGKYKNVHKAEITGPNGEAGCTIKFDYPLAFDKDSKVNGEFKKLAKKGVIGVGMTFIVKDGKIKWFEYFVRGSNPMNQFEAQLKNILEGKELISNGKMPVVEDQVLEDAGTVPVDVDPFGGIGDNY